MPRWIQDRETKKLIPVEEYERHYGANTRPRSKIMGDLPDFISPIDGTVVHGRRGWREMCKKHDVTHYSDFKNDWKEKAEKRKMIHEGRDPAERHKRKLDIAAAMEKTGNG